MASNPIFCEVDLTAAGKQTGFLRLPHSVHRSAYGFLPYPIATIANGDGPTVLLMSGNHGDEYEGQVILSTLIRELEPSDIRGRLIFLPMANFPAAMAGMRTSPIDAGNLNRSFPGDPKGNPTQVIAHYIESILMPDVDYLFDLHSGGSSLLYVPTVMLPRHGDDPAADLKEQVARDFGLPFATVYGRDDEAGYSSAAGFRKNVVTFATELGGAGMVNRAYAQMAKTGLERALVRLGVLDRAVEPPQTETRIFLNDSLVYAPEAGLFEPLAEPGDAVKPGDPAALLHYPESPGRDPIQIDFDVQGIVIAKRVPARSERGDCLFHIGCD
ncbi:succinylglutamate desuccinylase/aspartoacylase family protein [Hwanghaeella sp.]|uniref:succinylglutamate desuccinylase/aspartoacylase family protein n=1 Tax=Hwanghaeella sp. TaxID=2605943 RepID=UPI003CCB9812